MKKGISLLMTVILLLLLFASCGKSGEPVETTTGEASGQSTAADTSGEQTTAREYEVMGGEFVTEYPFERFFVSDATQSIYWDPRPIKDLVKSSPGTIRVRVTGFIPEGMVNDKERETYMSWYTLKITKAYRDYDYNPDEEYIVYYIGCPQVQFYRFPTLEIGEEYILVNVYPLNEDKAVYTLSMWLKIREIGGVEYVYPYFINCDVLENNIPITDAAEAEIVSDPVVIKYMDDNSIPHPKFNYKFELNDFIEQVKKLR